MSAIEHYQGYPEGPQGGIFVPVPAMDQTPLTIDIRTQGPNTDGWARNFIEITVDITQEQIDDASPRDGIYFCFTEFSDTPLKGLSHIGDYQFDQIPGVPTIVGVGQSVQERCPSHRPFLQLLSRNEKQCEVRIRQV